MSKKLTDAEVQQMAEHAWRQRQKPLEPAGKPFRSVPFSGLPRVGDGVLIAEGIRAEIEERGYADDAPLTPIPLGAGVVCMACGEKKHAKEIEDGWCVSCTESTRKMFANRTPEQARKQKEVSARHWRKCADAWTAKGEHATAADCLRQAEGLENQLDAMADSGGNDAA